MSCKPHCLTLQTPWGEKSWREQDTMLEATDWDHSGSRVEISWMCLSHGAFPMGSSELLMIQRKCCLLVENEGSSSKLVVRLQKKLREQRNRLKSSSWHLIPDSSKLWKTHHPWRGLLSTGSPVLCRTSTTARSIRVSDQYDFMRQRAAQFYGIQHTWNSEHPWLQYS